MTDAEPEVNLRPYGEMPEARQAGPFWVYDIPDVSTARAEAKLAHYLASPRSDAAAGRAGSWPFVVGVVGAAFLTFGAVVVVLSKVVAAGVLAMPVGAGLVIYAFRVWSGSSPDSPFVCASEYVKAIERGDFPRAYKLLAPVDRDTYTRAAPTEKEKDPRSIAWLPFDIEGSFTKYMAGARALGPSARLRMSASRQIHQLHPDLFIVPVKLTVLRTMKLEGEPQTLTVNKIVVRYGDEWRIFDGEVASAAELHNRWIKLPDSTE